MWVLFVTMLTVNANGGSLQWTKHSTYETEQACWIAVGTIQDELREGQYGDCQFVANEESQ